MTSRIIFLMIFCFNVLFSENITNEKVFVLSSLTYAYYEKIEEIDVQLGIQEKEDAFNYSDKEIDDLWKQLPEEFKEKLGMAYDSYVAYKQLLQSNDLLEAREKLFYGALHLSKAWLETIETDVKETFSLTLNTIENDNVQPLSVKNFVLNKENEITLDLIQTLKEKPEIVQLASAIDGFESNPFISKDAKNKIRPYLIRKSHPLLVNMDILFGSSRVTQDLSSFLTAGFIAKFKQPRSFIIVAAHPLLPGTLLKLHLDDELRQKKGVPGWVWFVKRCEGVKKIKKIIKDNNIVYFEVPRKYIYPLPAKFSPPNSPNYERKSVVLLVQDMNIFPTKESRKAWKSVFTHQHLNELYTIISLGNGSSYRPDNICYSKNGKFAFIDTEYPDRKPSYKSVRSYLSESMKSYWDLLVKKGGPKKI